jgi:hypothetical protein
LGLVFVIFVNVVFTIEAATRSKTMWVKIQWKPLYVIILPILWIFLSFFLKYWTEIDSKKVLKWIPFNQNSIIIFILISWSYSQIAFQKVCLDKLELEFKTLTPPICVTFAVLQSLEIHRSLKLCYKSNISSCALYFYLLTYAYQLSVH